MSMKKNQMNLLYGGTLVPLVTQKSLLVGGVFVFLEKRLHLLVINPDCQSIFCGGVQ